MQQVAYTEIMAEATQQMSKGGVLLSVAGIDGMADNVLTIGWGAIGFYWGMPVFTAVIRPSRHSYPMLLKTGEFSVSVPDGPCAALGYCGKHSGSEGDKFAAAGLTKAASQTIGAPIVADFGLHMECKVRLVQDMTQDRMNEAIVKNAYASGDLHTMFFGEITACYRTK